MSSKKKILLITILVLFVICLASAIIGLIIFKNSKETPSEEKNQSLVDGEKETNEENNQSLVDEEKETIGINVNEILENEGNATVYYSIEGDGEYTPSALAKKVIDYKKLKAPFFIKEVIVKTKSTEPLIEILNSYYLDNEQIRYYTYNYIAEKEFKRDYSKNIKDGLKCDGITETYAGEGDYIKCNKHDTGFEYNKIESEICVLIEEKPKCIKPNNDWSKIEEYKNEFESLGWTCTITDYEIKDQNQLECNYNELRLTLANSGEVIIGYESPYCYVNKDLATWCYNTGR